MHDEFGDAALDGGFRFGRGDIANDLAAKRGGHSAKLACGDFRELEGDNQGGRENRLAGLFVEFERDFDDCAGINAQLAIDVAVNREPVAAVAARNQRGAERQTLHRAANGNALFCRTQSATDFLGNVHKTDEPEFIDFRGEDVRSSGHDVYFAFAPEMAVAKPKAMRALPEMFF